MLDKDREDERVIIKTKCRLDIKGTKYDGIVDNISTLGASVEINASIKNKIRIGDTGALYVLLLSTIKYLFKVVRIDTKNIGLQFIGH